MPGGRPKGSRNKKDTAGLAAVKARINGFDPLVAMYELYIHPQTRIDQKIILANNMAPYFYAKLKSVEVKADVEGEIRFKYLGDNDPIPPKTAAEGDQ